MPNRDEVKGECRIQHDEELNDQHYSLNIVRVIRPKRIRWNGHEARTGKRRDV